MNRAYFVQFIACVVLTGCSSSEIPMNERSRWAGVTELPGWTVVATESALDGIQDAAEMKRRPSGHADELSLEQLTLDSFIEHGDGLTEDETREYGQLNDALHNKIRQLATERFKDTPLPAAYAESGRDPELMRSMGTPFTYQNTDWYDMSYHCHINVLRDYLSTDFIRSLQRLLTGEHQDWFIVVHGCEDIDFTSEDWLYISSDQLLLTDDVAAAFGISMD